LNHGMGLPSPRRKQPKDESQVPQQPNLELPSHTNRQSVGTKVCPWSVLVLFGDLDVLHGLTCLVSVFLVLTSWVLSCLVWFPVCSLGDEIRRDTTVLSVTTCRVIFGLPCDEMRLSPLRRDTVPPHDVKTSQDPT